MFRQDITLPTGVGADASLFRDCVWQGERLHEPLEHVLVPGNVRITRRGRRLQARAAKRNALQAVRSPNDRRFRTIVDIQSPPVRP